jgi:phage terminase small subunit
MTLPKPERDRAWRRARFVTNYVRCLNATQAAKEAGYSEKSAHVQGSQLLKNAKVRQEIDAILKRRLKKDELSAERILEELRRIATFDYRQFYDAEGNFKPPTEWTEEMGAVVSSSETVIKNVTAGDRKQDTVTKIRLNPKTDALNTLAKYFGLLSERVEHHGKLEIVWKDTEE